MQAINSFDMNATAINYSSLVDVIKDYGRTLGFQQVGITNKELTEDESHLLNWLHAGRHGEMKYMERHGIKRSRPQMLVAGTISVISVRMDYMPAAEHPANVLNKSQRAYISRYALGRDYHKVLRSRLQKLAEKIESITGKFGYRCFVDSAPVLEKALARNAGLGWIGKHSNLIHPKAGSWFFIGELYTDLPLPVDDSFTGNHCGTCRACLDICPTRAIISPYQVDARRCISYLTIELRGSIPEKFRPMIGNRIYGCDDCQLICPWNKFAKYTGEKDFGARHGLDQPSLIEVFNWTEQEFMQKTEGSAIRRIGYERWLRNLAIALGNARTSQAIISALKTRLAFPSDLVREHVEWALAQHEH